MKLAVCNFLPDKEVVKRSSVNFIHPINIKISNNDNVLRGNIL